MVNSISMFRVALLLVAMAACQGKTGEPVPPVTTTPAPGSGGRPDRPNEVCEAKARRFGARLEALVKDKPGLLPNPMPDGIALPAAPAAAKPIDEQGVVVALPSDREVVAESNTVATAEGPRLIDEMFSRGLAEAAAMDRGPKRPWTIYVWADKAVKASTLAAVLKEQLTEKRAWKVRLLVEGQPAASELEELSKPSIKTLVAALPKGGEPELFARAKAMRDAGDPCRALPMAYATSEIEAGPANTLAAMAKNLPAALIACGCNNSNWELWEYSMLRLFGAFQPSPRWIDMPSLSTADPRTVAELANDGVSRP